MVCNSNPKGYQTQKPRNIKLYLQLHTNSTSNSLLFTVLSAFLFEATYLRMLADRSLCEIIINI